MAPRASLRNESADEDVIPPVRNQARLGAMILVTVVVAVVLAVVSGGKVPAPGAVIPSPPATGELPALPAPEAWADMTWEPLVADPFGAPDVLRRVDGVVGDDRLLVAWGRTPMPGRNQFNDMGAVFASADGVTWQTIAIDHGVNPVSASTVSDVAIGPGGLLAVGSVCCDPEQPAVWHSSDGLAWQRLDPGDTLAPDRYLASVHAVRDGWLVLASGAADAGSEILFSTDGRSWQSVLHAAGTDSGPGIAALTRGSAGFVAVGTTEGDGGSYDGVVWRSEDGHAWERVAIDDPSLVGNGEVQLHSIVGHAGGMLVTGLLGTMEQRVQCEQLGMLASRDGMPIRDPADRTSCVSGDAQHWTSEDGDRWIPVPAPAEGESPIEFRVVAAGGPGLLVLGESSGPESPDTMLFASPDGITWEALGSEEPLLAELAIGMVVRGREITALTETWDGVKTTLRVWRGRAG